MLSKYLIKFIGLTLFTLGLFFVFTFVSSPSAQAAPDFICKKSDASYWNGAINMPSSVPTWIKGCFKRITIDQGWTGTVSFMYLSPETNDLSNGDKEATLNAVYYYRGTAGVNYAGMCMAVTSTSNSDGRTNVMAIPDVGFGFSVPCSGWLGHNQSRLTSSTVTLYASKFNAGSNKTATFNYRMAADFSNNSDGTNKSGLWCYDFANVGPAPTTSPPNSPWKNPPCVADGGNYTFVNIIKTPPIYDGTISIQKYKTGDTLGVTPSSPSPYNAPVGVRHSTYNSGTKTGNGSQFEEWVNHSNHNSNAQNNYEAYVDVPRGWKVVRATNRGSNAILQGSCGSGGTCYIGGVTVDDNNNVNPAPPPTWVDFFFEPDVRGNLDGACPRNSDQNGKFWGWVRDTYNNGGASQVDVYIDGTPGPGNSAWSNRYTANLPREAAVGGNYGFEGEIPLQFFDGNNHTIRVYVLRDGGGFDGGVGKNPYQLDGSPKTFNCPPPTGRVTCLKEGEQNYIQGWAFDPRKPEGRSHFHVYYDSSPGNTGDPDAIYNRNDVYGTEPLTSAEIDARKNDGYIIGAPRGIIAPTEDPPNEASKVYRFKIPIPDGLHDGGNHSVRVYMITVSGSNPGLEFVNAGTTELTFGPSNPNCGKVEKWWWPWLQTQNGDVVAKGEITGQSIARGIGEYPGARVANNPNREAEYLVISMAGGGGSFCSTYDYILTNTNALDKNPAGNPANCSNGSGYGTLSLYNLGEGVNDTVFKEIEESFTANGAGVAPNNTKCAPFNTQASLPANLNTGQGAETCENGTIFKFSGGNLNGFNIISGRNTIFRDGNLVIDGDIRTEDSGATFSSDNPKLHPNLAIIVNGDVYINRTVGRIDATIYATGKIYTCSNGSPIAFDQCNVQLTINGMLASKKGYDFRRTFANDGRQPAELIRLKGQNTAFPPPGLSSLYYEDSNSSVQIDSSEFQPRF